jgi:hypothetical protein
MGQGWSLAVHAQQIGLLACAKRHGQLQMFRASIVAPNASMPAVGKPCPKLTTTSFLTFEKPCAPSINQHRHDAHRSTHLEAEDNIRPRKICVGDRLISTLGHTEPVQRISPGTWRKHLYLSRSLDITRPCSEVERLASARWLSSCPRNTRQHFASQIVALSYVRAYLPSLQKHTVFAIA